MTASLFFNCAFKIYYYRLCSLMITRLMLNLRDPSFILSSANSSENTAYPDLTIVESNYPTQFSDRDGFAESESRAFHGDETWAEDVDPAGKHQFF